MQELAWSFNLVSFVAASQILLRTCFEVSLVPAGTAEAEPGHGEHFFQFRRLAGRAVDQRLSADLLNGFQLMTAGSTLIVVHGHGVVSAINSTVCARTKARATQQRAGLYPLNRACAAV